MATIFDSWCVMIYIFQLQGSQFPSKFDTVIPKTPRYESMVVWILK